MKSSVTNFLAIGFPMKNSMFLQRLSLLVAIICASTQALSETRERIRADVARSYERQVEIWAQSTELQSMETVSQLMNLSDALSNVRQQHEDIARRAREMSNEAIERFTSGVIEGALGGFVDALNTTLEPPLILPRDESKYQYGPYQNAYVGTCLYNVRDEASQTLRRTRFLIFCKGNASDQTEEVHLLQKARKLCNDFSGNLRGIGEFDVIDTIYGKESGPVLEEDELPGRLLHFPRNLPLNTCAAIPRDTGFLYVRKPHHINPWAKPDAGGIALESWPENLIY